MRKKRTLSKGWGRSLKEKRRRNKAPNALDYKIRGVMANITEYEFV